MADIRVSEIFTSIQGESHWAGYPCTFIRLTGCNLDCTYCDTRYARSGGELIAVDSVVESVRRAGVFTVEVTGGEPLAQAGTPELLGALVSAGHRVLLETNGSLPLDEVPPEIVVVMDLKAPGSAGTYKGNWRLREPGGQTFALSTGPFWVQIKVQAGGAVVLPPWPLRQQGDTGIEVFALQRLLRVAGEDLEADGNFGPATKNRVQHFQSTNGLAPDGIVGPATWPKLIVQVQAGNTSQAVRAVQELLNAKGGYGLAIDGIFGPATTNAVKDWQDDHGLADDGIVGTQTWRSLVGE